MKKITVIGAGGRMGKWFVRYFLKTKKYTVTGFDSQNKVSIKDCIVGKSLVSSILNADFVFLCTPIRQTAEVIRLISKEMKRDAFIIDIASEKTKTSSALSKIPLKINPICIHPMFGPGTQKVNGQNIIIIPIKDAKKELTVVKSLFAGANFVTTNAHEHDKKIGLILGLTHTINLILGSIITKDEKLQLIEKMSGTTFKAHRVLVDGLTSESPEMIESIMLNPEMRRYAEEFWKELGRVLTIIQENKTDELLDYIKKCQNDIADHTDTAKASKKLSSMTSSIK